MEKITILCGMKDYIDAYKFMSDVAESLPRCGVKVLSVSTDKLVINTKYTQIGFIYDKVAQPLHGVKADAVFGLEPYKQKLAIYLKELRPYDVGMGLVDYVCEVEKNGPELEAKAKYADASEKYDDAIRSMFITTTRSSGKTELMRRYIEELHKENDGPVFVASEWLKNNPHIKNNPQYILPEIKDIIFNNPATIVFWADGTKTVVQSRGEGYDPEKGLAMAISKKSLGNKHEYYHTFLHWLKKV